MRFEHALAEDVLRHAFVPSPQAAHDDPVLLETLASLASCSHTLHASMQPALAELRERIPPPYPGPEALDAALSSGDVARAAPLLAQAMIRLRRSLERIVQRLHVRGYPLATVCDCSGRALLSPARDIDELLAPLRERGLAVPLALEMFWRHVGGICLGSPSDAEHVRWWRAMLPCGTMVAERPRHLAASSALSHALSHAHAAPHTTSHTTSHTTPQAPSSLLAPSSEIAPVELTSSASWSLRRIDPLWIEHAAACLSAAQPDVQLTLPTDFAPDTGFAFRTGAVLEVVPDAFSKDHERSAPMHAAGSYAVWIEEAPPLDPTLLRFEVPAWHGAPTAHGASHGATPGSEGALWRSCSLVQYLRLAVLEAGGFPGAMGIPEYEGLRAELTHRLLPF